MLKDFFAQKGIVYTEKHVDQDTQARDEMMERSGGFLGVPYTYIEGENGETTSVVGFDKKKIEEVLKIG